MRTQRWQGSCFLPLKPPPASEEERPVKTLIKRILIGIVVGKLVSKVAGRRAAAA
jgi:hypothetical protein